MTITKFFVDKNRFDGVFTLSDLQHYFENVQPTIPFHGFFPDCGDQLLRLTGLRISRQGRCNWIELDELGVWFDQKLIYASDLRSQIPEDAQEVFLTFDEEQQKSGYGLAWNRHVSSLDWHPRTANGGAMKLANINWDNDRPEIDPYWWPNLNCIASDPRSREALAVVRDLFDDCPIGLRRQLQSIRSRWDELLPSLLNQYSDLIEGSIDTGAVESANDGTLIRSLIRARQDIGKWPETIGQYRWLASLKPSWRNDNSSKGSNYEFDVPTDFATERLLVSVNCETSDGEGCNARMTSAGESFNRPLSNRVPRIVGRLESNRFQLSLSNGTLVGAALYH